MRKFTSISLAITFLAALACQCVPAVEEYGRVFLRRAHRTADERIPLSVKIERMELIKEKLDSQVKDQAEKVARAEIALQDAEEYLSASENRCNGILGDLSTLRSACGKTKTYVTTSSRCGSTKSHSISRTQIVQALKQTAANWKIQKQALDARRTAVDAQRQAFEKLSDQFVRWKAQKDLLGHRIEMLKARHATQKLSDSADVTAIDGADLARAEQLADSIEKDLRIAEARDVIADESNSGLADTLREIDVIQENTATSTEDQILREVDNILDRIGGK